MGIQVGESGDGMKTTVGKLRNLCAEAVSAHPDYLKKEALREALQQIITTSVASGDVATQERLDGLFGDLSMALNALKGVPFDVWVKMATKATKVRKSR